MAVGERTDLEFPSGNGSCAAWVYRPGAARSGPGPCVVMGHGFSLTRHDGLSAYAEPLAAAGATVLVFDHRHLGDSPGRPRQRFRKPVQREDWRSAVTAARALDGVDPARIVLWGFSFGGGHAVETAAEDGRIAAVVALAPFVDGLARVLATPLPTVAWIVPRAIADLAGRTNLIPVTGPPGTKAAMALPGEADGFAAVVPPGSPWRNEITPGLFLTVAFHRPVAKAKKVTCPLWVGVGERDISVSGKAAERLATRAPKGELHRYPYDHWQACAGDAPARIVTDQIDFLRRQGLLGA
jgi:pimeloyl-ACP methyl ester carboxylesterase